MINRPKKQSNIYIIFEGGTQKSTRATKDRFINGNIHFGGNCLVFCVCSKPLLPHLAANQYLLSALYPHAIGNFIPNLIAGDFYGVIAEVSVTSGSGGFFMAE